MRSVMGPSIVADALGSTTGGPGTPELLFGVLGVILVGAGVLALWRSSRRRVGRVMSGIGGRSEFDRGIETLTRGDGSPVAVLAVVVDGLDEIADTHGRVAAEALVAEAKHLCVVHTAAGTQHRSWWSPRRQECSRRR